MKIGLNSKYIKPYQNCKLAKKFFRLFKVLYLVEKQAYKLELLKRKKIYNIFHVLLLENNSIRKKQVDKAMFKLEFENHSNDKKHEFQVIYNNAVYASKSKGHLSSFYYLLS